MNIEYIQNKINSTRWYDDLTVFDKYIEKEMVSKKFVNLVRKLKKVLQETYPDNWDLQITLKKSDIVEVNDYGFPYKVPKLFIEGVNAIVFFEDTTITNYKGISHPIKELFIRVSFSNLDMMAEKYHDDMPDINFRMDNNLQNIDYYYRYYPLKSTPKLMRTIYGTRTLHTHEEYVSKYSHSHLPGLTFGNWKDFCLGTGEINDTIMVLNSKPFMDIGTLKLFFFCLESIVIWESIGGVPHVRMTRIFNKEGGVNVISDEDASNYAKRIIKHIQFHPILAKRGINVGIREGKYFIKDDDKFHKFLSRISEKYDIVGYVGYKYYKDDNGNFYCADTGDNEEISEAFNLDTEDVLFQGKIYKPRIEGNVNINNINSELYIHPKIKDYVKEQLEYKINSKRISQSRAKARVEGSNA